MHLFCSYSFINQMSYWQSFWTVSINLKNQFQLIITFHIIRNILKTIQGRLTNVLGCSASGVTASFGEMLLLMAIHFHSNQLSAIFELVSSTLGMKVPIRHNNMTRMKQIFTQEIFTEQVIIVKHTSFTTVLCNRLNSVRGCRLGRGADYA